MDETICLIANRRVVSKIRSMRMDRNSIVVRDLESCRPRSIEGMRDKDVNLPKYPLPVSGQAEVRIATAVNRRRSHDALWQGSNAS